MKAKIVIKLGGSALHNFKTLQELVSLVRGYRERHYDVIIVHGGGPAINQELTARGIQWQFIRGQRQTTTAMMEVIEDVLANKVNSMLVNALKAANLPAVGFSGAQNQTLFCTQADPELLQVGNIQSVRIESLQQLLKHEDGGSLPVVAPLGIGAAGELYNINADWAAAKIAIALQAEKLIFLTDQNGLLDGEGELVHRTNPSRIQQMIQEGIILGGMYTKVMTMMTALQYGVSQIRVLNATNASQLLNLDNIGTLLVEDANEASKEVPAWTQMR